MISVKSPLKHKEIIEVVTTEFSDVQLISDEKLQICFSTPDDEEYFSKIKSAIKGSTFGSVLYFQVEKK